MVESQETAASEPVLFEALTSHHRLNSTRNPFLGIPPRSIHFCLVIPLCFLTIPPFR